MTGRTHSGLDDPRVDRNARLQTANLDLGAGFERDLDGRLQLRVAAPLVQGKDGAYTVEVDDPAASQKAPVAALTVGADFPPDPAPGHAHIHTGLDHDLFVWDGFRGKWLTARQETIAFTAQATLAIGAFFRLFQGPNTSATLGDKLLTNMTLVAIKATKNNTGAAPTVDVMAAGVVKHSHTYQSTAEVSNQSGINVDLATGDIINCQVSGVGVTNGGTVTCLLRRRP